MTERGAIHRATRWLWWLAAAIGIVMVLALWNTPGWQQFRHDTATNLELADQVNDCAGECTTDEL